MNQNQPNQTVKSLHRQWNQILQQRVYKVVDDLYRKLMQSGG